MILMLGEIVLAHEEWDSLRTIAELKVSIHIIFEELSSDHLSSGLAREIVISFYGTVEEVSSMVLLLSPERTILQR